MTNLLHSDWLRAVQFKCNASAKSVTTVQRHIKVLNYGWLKDNMNFSRQWYHVKWWRKFCAEIFKNVTHNGKKSLKKIFWHFLHAHSFMFILSTEAARAISDLWKTRKCKLIPNWKRKTVWLPIITGDSPTKRLTDLATNKANRLTDPPTDWRTVWLADWFTDARTDSLNDWVVGFLADCLHHLSYDLWSNR